MRGVYAFFYLSCRYSSCSWGKPAPGSKVNELCVFLWNTRNWGRGVRYFGGGLKDQDRIFQNIYGEHDTGIDAAMKRGDWYKTGEIVAKVRK